MTSGSNDVVSSSPAGNKNSVLPSLHKQYPAVFAWLDQLSNPYLSDTGEANYARRFKLPLETFQTILKAYRKEVRNGN
jgi:hypothetical protein